MKVEQVAIARVIPYEKNPRKNEAAVAKVAASIREFGFRQPIVVDEKMVVIAGHTRLQAAAQLGLAQVPVHIARGLSPAKVRAYRLADNRTNEDAEWDRGMLRDELAALKLDSFDLALTGFDPDELAVLLDSLDPNNLEEAPEAQLDKAEELGKKWKVARGQLWEIPSATGERSHRILCGDSGKPAEVSALMAGAKASLLATDPPYGVAFGVDSGPDSAKRFTAIAGDEADGPRLQAFLEGVFRAAIPHLRPEAAWYLWHAQMTQGFFAAAAAAAALLIHRQIIWVKSHFILGHGDYHWQHELCFYGWREGHRARWFGDRAQSTLWVVKNPRAHELHPTQKPVELFARPMKFNTLPGETCYEPFSGSGTQLCAAELAGRLCYAMEIEPKYVAVALERLSDMGLTPKLASPDSRCDPPKRKKKAR